MATATLSHRSPDPADPFPRSPLERALGHPFAYTLTALVLVTLFGWTFFTHPDRVAPTHDPAYYTWRTEALITEKPAALLAITGPFDVFSGGYRVSSAVLGGFLRRIPEVAQLKVTVFFVVGLPVLIALLLGGFALRQRGDPLIFHVVALGSASLLLTPPFIGYLDNVLCLFFLAAALWFITPARSSWPARAGLVLFLLACGFTHPTTLAIFCAVLGAMALATLILTRDWKESMRRDGPVLCAAAGSALLTVLAWKLGIWGRSASLSDAALAPPYGSGFFLDRMGDWVQSMHPLLNGPLFLAGLAGLLAAGRRTVHDDLARVAIVWLLPLIGLFGFLWGFTYPYYRFFNTTLAWVLLVGIGAYFIVRFFADRLSKGGILRVGALGIVAVLLIIGSNFVHGLSELGWNDPGSGWLTQEEKLDLDALRGYLTRLGQPERPVVFVVDNKPTRPFQIYGYLKLTGNTARYGLPPGEIDNGYVYLGSLQNFFRSQPTLTGQPTYDRLSRAFLADAERGIKASGRKPVVVLDRAFNLSGSKAAGSVGPITGAHGVSLLEIAHGRVNPVSGQPGPAGAPSRPFDRVIVGTTSIWHLVRLLLGLVILFLPGLLAIEWFLPGATFPEKLGMIPALSMALLALVGVVVLAVTRSPFSGFLAWLSVGVAVAAGACLHIWQRNHLPRGHFTYGFPSA